MLFTTIFFHLQGYSTLKLPRLSDMKKLSGTFTLLFLMFHLKIKPTFAYMYYCYFLPIKPFHYKKRKSCKHDVCVSGIISYNSLVYMVYTIFLFIICIILYALFAYLLRFYTNWMTPHVWGLPWPSGKEFSCQCRRHRT